jgi:hypothetical protein
VTLTEIAEVPPPLTDTIVGLALMVMLFGFFVWTMSWTGLVALPLASVAVMWQVPAVVDAL